MTVRSSTVFFLSFLALQPCLAEWAFSEESATIMRSPGAKFELRVFRGKTDKWYIGVFLSRYPEVSAVWVANRDEPLLTSTGILKIFNSSLLLVNQSGGTVWQTDGGGYTTTQPLVAELNDDGNFVLRHSNYSDPKTLWQGFQHPTDTLLPGMEFGSGSRDPEQILRSWASLDDPSSGRYSYVTEPKSGNGELEGFIFGDKAEVLYRVDPGLLNKILARSHNGVQYAIMGSTTSFSFPMLKLLDSGFLVWLGWRFATERWQNASWDYPTDDSDLYKVCPTNSYCFVNQERVVACACFKGFRESQDAPHTCVRKSPLSCVDKEFQRLTKMKNPFMGHETSVHAEIGLEKCEEMCLVNCSCAAFANALMPNEGFACAMWTGLELEDIRRYRTDQVQGQDLYVRVAAAEIWEERRKKRIIGFTTGASALLILVACLLSFWKRRKLAAAAAAASVTTPVETSNQDVPLERIDESESGFMDFDLIAQATDNFSVANKIGEGGFRMVYKGRLLDGQEIAVKRLTKLSAHGIRGFETEMRLIKVLQHVNLVRLLGYFYDHQEKILVYELLENSSLDTYLFGGTTGSPVLNWDKRFDITNGIARGLLYLHRDSRHRVVHLDIKASNILLGKDLTPKISDFGMAKILRGDDTEGYVTVAAGTYGYMAPEYVGSEWYSVKSDVFSFGVLLLEIVSGKGIRNFSRVNDGQNLLTFIWRNWIEGKGLEMVDPVMASYPPEQVIRCLQIGLLCVQENPEDRPTMSCVVSMLESESEITHQPKSPVETGSSSRAAPASSSIAQATLSSIQAR